MLEAVQPLDVGAHGVALAADQIVRAAAQLVDRTSDPLHRAILLNFWRHVHLEGAGEYDKIVAPDMMVDEPVYRVTWGANPAVITGKDGVLAFYRSVGEAVLPSLKLRSLPIAWTFFRTLRTLPAIVISWTG